jgi:hypothetical protein
MSEDEVAFLESHGWKFGFDDHLRLFLDVYSADAGGFKMRELRTISINIGETCL